MPTKKEARSRRELAKAKRKKWFIIGFAATLLVGVALIIYARFRL